VILCWTVHFFFTLSSSLLTLVVCSRNDTVCADDLDILESDPEVREEDWHIRSTYQSGVDRSILS
jgi:hypothetical protein